MAFFKKDFLEQQTQASAPFNIGTADKVQTLQQYGEHRSTTSNSSSVLNPNQYLNMNGTLGSQQNQNLGPTQIFYNTGAQGGASMGSNQYLQGIPPMQTNNHL